ncbi:hypothetical protein H072_4107 [Dactylellina haptotyla CBS 200.50]|uniref:Uncharacterized protein n=1 Tax=Dactylellina haptotyla (strain CBS 200.50) TaxID=1284197 RepID=S8C2R6_DACHA|nr:hypothetical protein H072_4107 [Dactylellina haptotyla CBS 200.50]
MGGYIITRNPDEKKLPEFLSAARFARENCLENQLETKDAVATRYIAIDGRGNDINKSTRGDDSLLSRAGELATYNSLFPHSIQTPVRLGDDDINRQTAHCQVFPADISTNTRQQVYTPRLVVTGRADRTKSRRISPNSSKEQTKTPGSPQRSDLPKTPMSWSSEDDILLRDLKELRKLGWKEISAYFPKRTAHACQFRWRRLVSGTLKGHRQCVPQVTNGSPLSGSADRKDADGKITFGTFEHATSKSCPSDLFEVSSLESDSKQLATSLAISSPSSPSDHLESKRTRSPTLASRSVSFSPPAIRQHQYYQRTDEREKIHTKWETEDCLDNDHVESGHSALFEDTLQIHKSQCGHSEFSHSSTNYTYHGASSQRLSEPTSWTSEEDSLLLNRRLSFDEVSILLHHRSEEAIWSRMGILRSSISKSVRINRPSLVT